MISKKLIIISLLFGVLLTLMPIPSVVQTEKDRGTFTVYICDRGFPFGYICAWECEGEICATVDADTSTKFNIPYLALNILINSTLIFSVINMPGILGTRRIKA